MLLDIIIDSDSITRLVTEIFKGLIIGTIGFIFFSFVCVSVRMVIDGRRSLYHFLIQLFMLAGGVTLLIFVVDLCFGINLIDYLLK